MKNLPGTFSLSVRTLFSQKCHTEQMKNSRRERMKISVHTEMSSLSETIQTKKNQGWGGRNKNKLTAKSRRIFSDEKLMFAGFVCAPSIFPQFIFIQAAAHTFSSGKLCFCAQVFAFSFWKFSTSREFLIIHTKLRQDDLMPRKIHSRDEHKFHEPECEGNFASLKALSCTNTHSRDIERVSIRKSNPS